MDTIASVKIGDLPVVIKFILQSLVQERPEKTLEVCSKDVISLEYEM